MHDPTPGPSRRRFLAGLAAAGAAPAALAAPPAADDRDDLAAAQRLFGLDFAPAELDQALATVRGFRDDFAALRAAPLAQFTDPAFQFDPLPPGAARPPREGPEPFRPAATDRLGTTDLDLAFASVTELQSLLRAGAVTSRRLVELALARLQRFDPDLHCVVNLVPGALEAADRADAELRAGKPRGPLHGIPFGAKDLFAHPAAPTTFGAAPFRDQVIDATATVLARLERAGAVLVAKLSLGALAMGDLWFGGRTRNPWNPDRGSSGSSAGSAAATAAGLLPFALGTETLGSIISPAVRCSVTGLRPTFGTVPRTGAMALSWTMDKVGVLARNASDCAWVFDAIRGADAADLASRDAGFPWLPRPDLRGLRIGFLPAGRTDFASGPEAEILDHLRRAGAEVAAATLPDAPYSALRLILTAEAAAAFDDLTRSGGVRQLTDQSDAAWPTRFRAGRFIPAVEYLRASRLRAELMAAMAACMAAFDALVSPTHGGPTLLCTNLTGHPSLAMPFAAGRGDQPRSISLVGRLYGEATILRIADHWQQHTDWHRRRPPLTGR